MKKILSLLGLCVALCGTAKSQVTSGSVSNTASAWLGALSSTNLITGTYALYDLTTKTAGAGIFAKYDMSDYVGALIRMDYINHETYTARGGVQVQLPVRLGAVGSSVYLIPYSGALVGTSLGGKGNGEPIYIGFIGAAIQFSAHFGIFGGYERWTGGGFNDDLVAVGAGYKF